MILGTMGGHMGKSGHMTSCAAPRQMFHERPQGSFFNDGPWLLEHPGNDVDDTFQKAFMWDDLLAGKYNFIGAYGANETSEEREINIKCVYNFVMNITANAMNTPSAVEFYKTVDLAVANAIRFDDNARWFDFVLPVPMLWEKGTFINQGFERAMVSTKLVEPPYEIKDEIWIGRELLNRWGLDADSAYPYDYPELYYNQVFGTTVLREDGEYEPLISFTEEEAKSLWEGGEARAEGRISWTDFCKQGIYRVERSPGDAFAAVSAAAFVSDPENNPVPSQSGKLEFYSKEAVRITTALKISDPIDPIPTYVPTLNGYESTFSDFENGVKGEYPFQMFTPKYYRCKHSHFEYLPWMKEAFARPIFLNAQDAAEKGIQEGDTVRIWNDNGSILRPATVTQRIVPGVVGMPHGGIPEHDFNTGIDVDGASNWLTYGVSTGMGTDGYCSQVCNFEKYDVPLEPDATRDLMPIPAVQMV
jgi:anaerobic dimethyl sulfoxide reductase subunit A